MRVLVVEDEENIARALQIGLRSEGFEVEVERTGDAGLWRAQEGTFDAIILDLMLPRMNGYKICAQLRSEGDRTPILMLTAKDGDFEGHVASLTIGLLCPHRLGEGARISQQWVKWSVSRAHRVICTSRFISALGWVRVSQLLAVELAATFSKSGSRTRG